MRCTSFVEEMPDKLWESNFCRYRFPLELVSAVFDLVFAEGVEAIFRFAIALIKRNEDVLLKLEFEDLIEFLKNGLFEVYAVSNLFPLFPFFIYRMEELIETTLIFSQRGKRRRRIRTHFIE